jgi:hypothetical protein
MERVMEVLKSIDINYIYVIVGIVGGETEGGRSLGAGRIPKS